MSANEHSAVLRYVHRAVHQAQANVPDRELLQRFVRNRDEAAFELLVWRHSALVTSVCRQILRDTHLAEDAFQATFLVLAKKAKTIRKHGALAGWLYQVAFRIAQRAAKREAQRSTREQAAAQARLSYATAQPSDDFERRDRQAALHDEINKLPAKYRDPILLCYLSGKSNAEAATQLGWTKGTVSGRLARARDILRRRLSKRGVIVPAGILWLTTWLTTHSVSASVVQTTANIAVSFASGQLAAASSGGLNLAQGELRTMFWIKTKMIAALVMLLSIAGVAAALMMHDTRPAEDKPVLRIAHDGEAQKKTKPDQQQEVRKHNVRGAASALDGIVLVVGRKAKKDEEVPKNRVMEVTIGAHRGKYREWRVGDFVKQGELLAQLDDRKARLELENAKAKITLIHVQYTAAKKTYQEAQARLDRAKPLVKKGVIPLREFTAITLTRDKFQADMDAKKAELRLVETSLQLAEFNIASHQIHSAVSGYIRAIHKQSGEGIQALQSIVTIELSEKKLSEKKK